jgi:hypothetical protein
LDTSHLEKTAEGKIASELQAAGLLVAKPKFDQKGTDLLVFAEMKDGVKFCRAQCKGRSVVKRASNVILEPNYVTPGFICFLYVKAKDGQRIYFFLGSEIELWEKNRIGKYYLHISRTDYETSLSKHVLDESKIQLIRTVILAAETSGEFRRLFPARAFITERPCEATAFGTCVSGVVPYPPLDGFPLLAYNPDLFGKEIHTEDGRVSVRDAVAAIDECFDPAKVAEKLGTSAEHIVQALRYAQKAGLVVIKVAGRGVE